MVAFPTSENLISSNGVKNSQMAVKPSEMSHCGVHFTVFTQNNSFFLLAITRMVRSYIGLSGIKFSQKWYTASREIIIEDCLYEGSPGIVRFCSISTQSLSCFSF